MGQLSSRLTSSSTTTSSSTPQGSAPATGTSDYLHTSPTPSTTSSISGRRPVFSTSSESLALNTRLSSLRRRRSSTNNHSLAPPSRRRRLRFWSRSDDNQSSSVPLTHPSTESLRDTIIGETIDESISPIYAPIEGSSGSGNITRTSTNAEPASRFIDELDDIASDLFSAVSRENRPTVRQYSSLSSARSSSSSSNTQRQTHTHTRHNNHLHSHRDNLRGSGENVTSFEHQTEMLSRLLEVAATSTVYTLMGSTAANGRRFDNTNVNQTSNDSTFQEFVTSLRNGLLASELSRNLNDSPSSRDNMTFFRAFRFDSDTSPVVNNVFQSSLTGNSMTANSMNFSLSSHNSTGGNPATSSTNFTDSDQPFVPVIIVGIRSVSQGSDSNDLFTADGNEEEINLTEHSFQSSNGSSSEPTENVSSNQSFSSSMSSSSLSNDENPSWNTQQRSWVIFVMGNTFSWNHPLLSAPSLMSENPTYEDLINLQELIGQVKPQVATEDDLHKNDEQLFEIQLKNSKNFTNKSKHPVFQQTSTALDRCQICLTEYEDHEIVRKLGSCSHFYHQDCIDTWLLNGKNNCPLCRSKAVVTADGKEGVTV